MLLPEHLTYDRLQAQADVPGIVRIYLRADGSSPTGSVLKGDLIPVDLPLADDEPIAPAQLVTRAKAWLCDQVNAGTRTL